MCPPRYHGQPIAFRPRERDGERSQRKKKKTGRRGGGGVPFSRFGVHTKKKKNLTGAEGTWKVGMNRGEALRKYDSAGGSSQRWTTVV